MTSTITLQQERWNGRALGEQDSPLHELQTMLLRDARELRDSVMSLADALQTSSIEEIESRLAIVAAIAGPQFRYQEEALLPALDGALGWICAGELIGRHDLALEVIDLLVDLVAVSTLSAKDREEGAALVRQLLMGVAETYGLIVLLERVSEEQQERVRQARTNARLEGLDLFHWEEDVRQHVRNPHPVVPCGPHSEIP